MHKGGGTSEETPLMGLWTWQEAVPGEKLNNSWVLDALTMGRQREERWNCPGKQSRGPQNAGEKARTS